MRSGESLTLSPELGYTTVKLNTGVGVLESSKQEFSQRDWGDDSVGKVLGTQCED